MELKINKNKRYNELVEKRCFSRKTIYCHDLYVDAVDPETGHVDVDYALTKKGRKKNRRAREEREGRMNGNKQTQADEVVVEAEVEEKVASASLLSARERVERLVKYDRERLARSQVYDDQSDYFADSTSTWLTKEEKEEASRLDEKERYVFY